MLSFMNDTLQFAKDNQEKVFMVFVRSSLWDHHWLLSMIRLKILQMFSSFCNLQQFEETFLFTL